MKNIFRKNLLFYTFLGCILFISFNVLFAAAVKEKSVRIVYTASLKGNMDGCTCFDHPKGGLVKSADFIRQQAGKKTLLVDAGDLLDAQPDDLIAPYLFDSYKDLGYDAVAIGENEFADGAGYFVKYDKTCPFISMNVTITPEQSQLFTLPDSARIIKKNNVQIGVFALMDPQVLTTTNVSNLTSAAKADPAEVSAKSAVLYFKKKKVDLCVLLYHGYYDNLTNLIAGVPGIDIVILGHEEKLIGAEKFRNTIIVSPGESGNRVGTIDLAVSKKGISRFTNSFRHFSYKKDPDDKAVRERIKKYEEEMISRLQSGGTK
jgi:2',3'-cyclic-nucleotide 2'-phosphodiesterase / 3'-nucleotidase